MKILILADNFINGGLETHILTLYENLKSNNEFYFAFGNYKNNNKLPDERVYKDFNFNNNVTIRGFCNDVDRLVNIINENKIDVINVHPFYCIFAAIFAAHITNVKLVYTYHGKGSFNFTSNIIDTILFEYAFESTINKILCVSMQGIESFNSLHTSNTFLLKNPLDLNQYKITKIKNNKKWALISRLDEDKYPEISKLFLQLEHYDIKEVDIYGDGTSLEKLKSEAKNIKVKIDFKGFSSNIGNDILNKYTGIIGMGRSAIEALAMNYPVLLIGFNKVCGIIDKELFDIVSPYNFVCNYCNEKNIENISKQIDEINSGKYHKYLLSSEIVKQYDSKIISGYYIKELTNTNFISLNNVVMLFKNIKNLIAFGDGNHKIFSSENVYYLMKNDIENFTKNIGLKNFFVIHDYQLKKEKKFLKQIEVLKEKQNKTNLEFQNIKNIGLAYIIKNTMKILLLKIKLLFGKEK